MLTWLESCNVVVLTEAVPLALRRETENVARSVFGADPVFEMTLNAATMQPQYELLPLDSVKFAEVEPELEQRS
jgi:hypothetical protein